MTDAPNRLVDSAKLPARANLEHLKNEARQRLKTIRSQRTAARLSEAQLLVARSYGFPSWRKLKSYVEALNDFGQELINAVRAADLETIRKLLDDHPELVNASTDVHLRVRPSDALTMRLVHLAIAEAKIDVLQLLIQHGADLNARNADGRLPLHDCFELGRDDFAKVLLDAGAAPDVCVAAAYGVSLAISDDKSGQSDAWKTDQPNFVITITLVTAAVHNLARLIRLLGQSCQ